MIIIFDSKEHHIHVFFLNSQMENITRLFSAVKISWFNLYEQYLAIKFFFDNFYEIYVCVKYLNFIN